MNCLITIISIDFNYPCTVSDHLKKSQGIGSGNGGGLEGPTFFVAMGHSPPHFSRLINYFTLFYHGQLIRT